MFDKMLKDTARSLELLFSPDERSTTQKIPKRCIMNEDVTILIWPDDTKTIVRRMEGDKNNPRLAFLTAYFQKHSGLSKNKANKYLDILENDNADAK